MPTAPNRTNRQEIDAKNGEGWCATNDAGGWQEGGCRNAGTPALTGLRSQLDPPMKPQDPQAESITFGVELETTIPALSGVTIGGYPTERDKAIEV